MAFVILRIFFLLDTPPDLFIHPLTAWLTFRNNSLRKSGNVVSVPLVECCDYLFTRCNRVVVKPGVHTNDIATIHGRPVRIHTAPAEDNYRPYVESTVDSAGAV